MSESNFDKLKFNMGEKTILGIDVGSTTIKLILVKKNKLIFSCYERHFSQVRSKTLELLKKLSAFLCDDDVIYTAISGSAGYGLAESTKMPFVQEVFATSEAVKELEPDTEAVIELGGEDAKVIFYGAVPDERMNGTCAGGTGAFIDQMATLLNISNDEFDRLSLNATKLYTIASRCGVFAKTDVQPLINQGARKEDIASSIYQAVVNQTISGLAQDNEIKGKVLFLGGPLYYCKGLRLRFTETLSLSPDEAIFPDNGIYAVAIGCAIYASKNNSTYKYKDLISIISNADKNSDKKTGLAPLFNNKAEYDAFAERHAKASIAESPIESYCGNAFLGIDCGSTTTKLVLIDDDSRILYKYYSSNLGSPLELVKGQLEHIYKLCNDKITIKCSCVTGYGEELIKNAFSIDCGLVETIAHFTAAKFFNPKVDFILDIGGQDIKCFKIRNNSIDSIMLNEACSSGCGSFIETFAKLADYSVEDFAKLGLFAKYPVDLGSRCTVFMNSSVKQSQKDGAGADDISAGLSMSVVKNALYKVIRVTSHDELGKEIVVQGGTFLNDSVLRSFEQLLGRNVIRPQIAGLMGAYGAALYAKEHKGVSSAIITADELKSFKHKVKALNCNGCANHCNLTVNIFGDSKKYISGNKCEKGAGIKAINEDVPNLYQYKRDELKCLSAESSCSPCADKKNFTIGLPLALGMYEAAPFWHRIFSMLGFNVVLSGLSSRDTYIKGQHTIPSDTACYPAKLMHGHIEELSEQNVDAIFYPGLTYNFDEGESDNCYNCPVVAYYSELLNANIKSLQKTQFWFPYLNINSSRELSKELYSFLKEHNFDINLRRVKIAVMEGYEAYHNHMANIRKEGKLAIEYARSHNKQILILAGRPYHADPEICHLIDKLAIELGFVVVSEDSVSRMTAPQEVDVLNQWTYHSRLYNAAKFAAENDDCQLVQLVSFGCGIDSITTDEIRSILEQNGKLYTQLKIDEINNLGAVKIRLRSLIAALKG